mmetsp:Transcript_44266/g.172310  ORF Transcript_44266/g.172310 Transcript_44266/m.172310 type:complete len:107 (+) Transcript_44266:142-462(+)
MHPSLSGRRCFCSPRLSTFISQRGNHLAFLLASYPKRCGNRTGGDPLFLHSVGVQFSGKVRHTKLAESEVFAFVQFGTCKIERSLSRGEACLELLFLVGGCSTQIL